MDHLAMLRRWTSGGTSWNPPPLLLDVKLVGCAAFLVKYAEVNTMAAFCEAGHDPQDSNGSNKITLVSKW